MNKVFRKTAAVLMSVAMAFSTVPSSYAAVSSDTDATYSVQQKSTASAKLGASSGSAYAAVLRSDKVGNAAQTETTAGYNQQVETKLSEASGNVSATYFEQDKYISEPTGEKNGQSTYNITIENAYVGAKVTTYAPNGQDIIIIEDASSSMMGHTDVEATAVEQLLQNIHDENVKRIDDAMAGKYDGSINPEGKSRTQIQQEMIDGGYLLRLTGIESYNRATTNRYNGKSYLLTTADLNTAIAAAKEGLATLDDLTRTDLALKDISSNRYGYGNDWQRTSIVLITDGAPYDWTDSVDNGYLMSSDATNEALSAAASLKSQGATIYSLFLPWDSECDMTMYNKAIETKDVSQLLSNGVITPRGNIAAIFISLVSSDYATAKFNTVSGTKMFDNTVTYTTNGNGYGKYSKYVANTKEIVDSVSEVATKIQKETFDDAQKAAGYAGVNSYILDDISYPFGLNGNLSNIKVYQVPRVPTELDSTNHVPDASNVTSFTWGQKEDITDQVEVSLEGNRIKVSGYSYEANALTNYDHDLLLADDMKPADPTKYETGDYGYKLVIEFPIYAKENFGGNDIETNDSTTSGFYPSTPAADTGKPSWNANTALNPNRAEYVALYPVPTVDLTVNYSIVSGDMVIYAPQTAKLLNLVTNDTTNENLSIFASTHVPDGDNNAFVDIAYTLTSPSGKIVGTLNIPHGTKLVGAKDNTGSIKWTFTDGDDATVTESGTYRISCTVTPVATTRAESHTGSSKADETCQAKTYTQDPTSKIYQLQITVKDTAKKPGQTLDFSDSTNEDVFSAVSSSDWREVHWVSAKWVCIDGSTASETANEPGKAALKVGEKPLGLVSVGDESNVSDIDGTKAVLKTAADNSTIPVRISVTRKIGDLNKDVSLVDQTILTATDMSDDDHLYGAYSSIVWKHECDVADDCDNNALATARNDIDGGKTTGQNITRFLIHISDTILPEIDKSTTTPTIDVGDDIEWTVTVRNDNSKENKNHKTTKAQMIDVLPYQNDGRENPTNNKEGGSSFGSELYFKTISVDCSSATSMASAYQSGSAKFYYTTDTAVRTASREQWYNGGSIKWTEVSPSVNGNTVTFSVPQDAVAIKSDTSLAWNQKLVFNLTANVKDKNQQQTHDVYINQAFVGNDDATKASDPVVTELVPVAITGTIWYDNNGNGQMDSSEEKAQNVTVNLYRQLTNSTTEHITLENINLERVYNSKEELVSTYVTGSNGYFEFNNLPAGKYYVVATNIDGDYNVTKQKASGTDNALNSKAEESMPAGQTAWIREIEVGTSSVPYQNIGLVVQKGTVTVTKVLENGKMYTTGSMTEEQKASLTRNFVFNLKDEKTGAEYSASVVVNKDNVDGVSATFEELPLGTYTLTETTSLGYEVASMEVQSGNVQYDASTKKATIYISSGNTDVDIVVNNKTTETDPGVYPGEGVVNHVGTAMPISFKVNYTHGDINDQSAISYTFKQSDFSNMTVWYDDGTYRDFTGMYRKNADGTVEKIANDPLRFDEITLSPTTVTNAQNTGESGNDVMISAYFSEKGKTFSDQFSVKVNLKPLHKFTVIFHANGTSFSGSRDTNTVRFSYNDAKQSNDIISGTYSDPNAHNGWTFAGWNTASNGSGTNYASLTALNEIGANQTNVTQIDLYAHWTTTITFNANGGTLAGGTTQEESQYNGAATGTVKVNVGSTYSTNMYANKSGYYTFIGWNTNASGNGTWLADYGAINSPATFYAIYISTKWTYSYTGSSQAFTAPVAGTYRFVAKGGSGGSSGRAGGATVSGDIYLQKGTTLYVYVGGAGGDSTYSSTASGGWNGGGTGGKSLDDSEGTHVSGGGGGATDIRTIDSGSNWSYSAGLYSRIMVASGGGGTGRDGWGAPGGTANGKNGNGIGHGGIGGYGGTGASQTAGYDGGSFGQGGSGIGGTGYGGGGGGWYGGGAYSTDGGGSGSSYVSGASWCSYTNGTGYKFSNISASEGSWWSGDAYAEITLIAR